MTEQRNHDIFREWAEASATMGDLARKHELSRARIAQIIFAEGRRYRKRLRAAAALYERAGDTLHELARQLGDLAADPLDQAIVSSAPSILDQRVDEWETSVRTANCLKAEGIEYLGELVRLGEGEMLRIPNFGRKSLNEVKWLLAERGLSLGSPDPTWAPTWARPTL